MKQVEKNELKNLIREVLKENNIVKKTKEEKIQDKNNFIKEFKKLQKKADAMFWEGVEKGMFTEFGGYEGIETIRHGNELYIEYTSGRREKVFEYVRDRFGYYTI